MENALSMVEMQQPNSARDEKLLLIGRGFSVCLNLIQKLRKANLAVILPDHESYLESRYDMKPFALY